VSEPAGKDDRQRQRALRTIYPLGKRCEGSRQ
jgi:hypothetical protein